MMNFQANGVIRNFTRCTSEQFERIRTDLDITLSDAILERLVSFYRDRMFRDPYIGELLFLDRLNACPKDLYAVRIDEMQSSDPEIGKTASVLWKSRRRPADPLTLGALFGMANADLVGRQSDFPVLLSGSDTENGTAFSLLLPGADSRAGKPQAGDLLVLLRPGNLSPDEYQAKVTEFCSNPDVCTRMRGVMTIGENGIFEPILTCLRGVHLDLCRLERSIADLFCRDDAGLRMILMPKSEVTTVNRLAEDAGFSPCIFTAVTQNGSFDIRLQTGEILSFPASFLRRFRIPAEQPIVSLLPEEPGVPTEISYQTDSVNGKSVAIAACRVDSAPFRCAIATACAAIAGQILAGSPPDACRIAVGMELPTKQAVPASTASVALGLYRVQRECGIPASAISLQASPAVSDPKLTVFAFSETTDSAMQTVSDGAGVYCAAFPVRPDGLPDFAGFRTMLQTISGLIRSGQIRIAELAVAEPTTAVLSRMQMPELQFVPDDPGIDLQSALPFAAILVSNDPLSFPRIGTFSLL